MDVNSKLMLKAKRKNSTEDDKSRNKSHKYSDNYLGFGSTFVLQNGEEKPQCVICKKILATESMLPNKLKRHLTSSNPQFENKSRSFFARKLNDMKRQVSTISKFTRLPSKALLASYQVAHRIAKCKKPHNIAEELVLPVAINLATTMIGEGAAEKLKLVPLSNDTVCRRIGDMALDIHDQLIDQLSDVAFSCAGIGSFHIEKVSLSFSLENCHSPRSFLQSHQNYYIYKHLYLILIVSNRTYNDRIVFDMHRQSVSLCIFELARGNKGRRKAGIQILRHHRLRQS